MTQAISEKKSVKIGDYVLTTKIGQGGVAEIFKARQESLDRDVAIKILSTKLGSDPDMIRRFERESRVIAGLNHPNIVHVIDKGHAGNRYYFVMEYVQGTNLREVIDSENIGLKTKLDMIVQVLKALDYAHKNGVIHRDIKPANILIDKQGNALVADFGIAQIVGTPDVDMTSSDIIMGTLSYMSPEQKLSSTNVDQTTDLYALGVILYEILLGKKPQGRFKLPTEIDQTIDKRFDTIISKCLAQDSKDRFQSAVELKDAILEITSAGAAPSEDFTLKGSESFLGKCRHLDTIKETEFSSTILVENLVNKKLYVIKKHSKGEAGRKEAQILRSLKHENIINLYGCGGDRKNTVIITEYAQGGSLADRMVRKRSWESAIEISLQIARGLDFAHKNNIMHGNLRPSNVLFDANDVVKLCDFGMPPHYDGPRKKNWYSPPELKRTKLGDVYGLGVILHQMITGRNPGYDSGNNLLVEDMRSYLPPEVIDMLSRLLAIRVAFRYKTFDAFIGDWDDFEQRRREDKRMRQTKRTAPITVDKKTPVWAYLLVSLGLAGVTILLLYVTGILQ